MGIFDLNFDSLIDISTLVYNYSVSAVPMIDLSVVNINPSQYQTSAFDINLNAILFVSATDYQ